MCPTIKKRGPNKYEVFLEGDEIQSCLTNKGDPDEQMRLDLSERVLKQDHTLAEARELCDRIINVVSADQLNQRNS